jgi:hypothetical protein
MASRTGLRYDKHVNHTHAVTHRAVLLARLAHLLDGHLELFGTAVERLEQRQEHLMCRIVSLDLLLGHPWEPTREAVVLRLAFGVSKLVKVLALLRV